MARPATAAVRLLTGEREPVRLATTANIDVDTGGLLTIDGIVTEVGDRVLVKDQTDGSENGIRTASAGQWYRASDSRTARTMQKGTTVHVQEGTANEGKTFVFNTLDPVVGDTPIVINFYLSDDVLGDVNDAIADGLADIAAAVSAAGFPASPTANTLLVRNAGNTAYDAKPFADVRDLLDTAPYVATRTALKALDTTKDAVAILTEAGRVGLFIWTAGNLSALATLDTQEGLVVKANAIATTAGAWVRATDPKFDPRWFGVLGDGATNDAVAFQACVTLANGRDIDISGLSIRVPTGNEITVPSTGLTLRGRGKIIYEGTGALFKAGTFTTTTYAFVATAAQTVFTNADSYTGAYVEVYQNGVLRPAWSNTITHDTTNITATFLNGGATVSDAVQIRVTRATASGLAAYSQVIIGSGVEIQTTQANAGRAFQLAWPDTGFLVGRQYPSFVMEVGAIIRGSTGSNGFTNAIWLHGSYNSKFGGDIYGIGGNLIPAGVTTDDTKCQWAIYLTGEWTTSDFRLYGGTIGNYYACVGSLFSTLEGLQITNFTFLEVGYAVYWDARSNDSGLQIDIKGCHANCQLGFVFSRYVSQAFINGNDVFQSTKSTKAFFRYIEFEGAKELIVSDNDFRSFVTGANTGAVVLRNGARGARIHDNYVCAADATSVCVGFICQSGSADSVIGPNTYEFVDRAVDVQAGSDRIGIITGGDVFISPPGAATTRYNMAGNNWWIDQKWLVLQNVANQAITTATLTLWAFTELRDPESLYSAGTLTAPAWATKVRIKGNLKWAANATGQRFFRTLKAATAGDVQEQMPANPVDNTAFLKFDEEFPITSGQTLEFQVYQNSGGNLNLTPSVAYVLFS